jgi:hypothetical protein
METHNRGSWVLAFSYRQVCQNPLNLTIPLTPLANSFIGDRDTPFGEEFFHLTKTKTESMVEPHRMANDLRGKTVTLVVGLLSFHTAQSATSELN